MEKRYTKPGAPITSFTGLTEAAWDVICDETTGTFTRKWLCARLPYGKRIENVIDRMAKNGDIRAVSRGVYISHFSE